MKHILIFAIKLYQKTLSPDHGFIKFLFPNLKVCTFYPTCSEYGIGAIGRYGARRGSWLTFLRLMRCHPWQNEHFDPVP